jgi:hypothetical protein
MTGYTRALLSALFAAAALHGAARIQVSGGINPTGGVKPLLFTWNSSVLVAGSGFAPGESVRIVLHGPLNSPRVAPDFGPWRPRRPSVGLGKLQADALERGARTAGTHVADLDLAMVSADAAGAFTASPNIPYDSAVTGLYARIPRPGLYAVIGVGSSSGAVAAADRIDICPATYTGGGNTAFDMGQDRGGRDGVLPGEFRQFSPERFDPEWPTVWDELPVQVYGTVTPTGSDPNAQPAQISASDNPPTHYAHDAIFSIDPDADYRWLVGTANFFSGEAGAPEIGRLKVEWETLNGGSTSSYNQGNIGLPLWATPSAGDRVYVVGRWILDAGHPEVGDRTEIHAARLVASMRKRPVAAASGASALQVDLYVSGHGGGANFSPPGLSAVLDQGGYGGGRIRDALSPSAQDVYYRPGPLAPLLVPVVNALLQAVAGISITVPVFGDAGPTAFPWGGPGSEERPINDMNYDFDVPLPPAPAGATTVRVDVANQPQHSTAVNEVVTFRAGPNGLPAAAHIHLPYLGADNRIYARTLRFSWNTAAPPVNHFVVRLTRVSVKDAAGKWQLWADVSGRWTYLTGAAPALLNTSAGQGIALPANQADVYLGAGDTLRIYVQGYRAACLDDYFGKLFGQSSYTAGLTFLAQCGPIDNQDLGGALLDLPPQPSPAGTYTLEGKDSTGKSHYSVDVAIDPGA